MFPVPRFPPTLRRLARDRRVPRPPVRWWRPAGRWAGLAAGVLLLSWWALPLVFPLPPVLRRPPLPSPVVLDREGGVLDRFPRDDFFRHQPVLGDELPPALVDATVVAEDKRFLRHDGLDYLAAARSLRDLLRDRRVTSGASTITQQLVKISSPPAPRNVATKIREALTARHLELHWSKSEILHAYLNRLDYGHHRQGCREAARYYFDKPLADLSLAECALLAGLPQAPGRHDPHRHPASALHRRNWILGRLRTERDYDPVLISASLSEPLRLSRERSRNPAPHLAAALRSGAAAGAPIRTTIDGALQREVTAVVREELARLDPANVRHAAVVVLDNAGGRVLALVGSGDFHDPRGGQINGALAPRSPGSALKPFTYLLAIERLGFFPGTVIADIPTAYRTAEGLDLPANFDRRHHGPVTIRHALANSLNVAAMRTLNRLGGPRPLHGFLGELGLTTLDGPPDDHGLGLTIGNAEVRLLELTNAYATLARLGRFLPPVLVAPPGSGPADPGRPVATPQAAFLVADILSDNRARTPAFGHRSSLRLPFRCAVKTGTSSDFRDSWCLGFTADFTVGVWTGNFDGSPTRGVTGAAGAGPIFHRTMLACHRNRPPRWLPTPGGLAGITIDSRTGHYFPEPPAPGHPFAVPEFCHARRLPHPVRPADYDPRGRAILDRQFCAWFESPDNSRRDQFVLGTSMPPAFGLRILSPIAGATYLLDPELPSGGRSLRLRSNLPDGARWSSPTLTIDGDTLRLRPGRHRITLTDSRSGASLARTITVESL